MELNLVKRAVCTAFAAGVAATLVACGGGGGSGSTAMTSSAPLLSSTTSATVPVLISDASSDDWVATIGVKILSIALITAGRRAPRSPSTTAPTPAPVVNLERSSIRSRRFSVMCRWPTGTYTGATLTISANPGDVDLVVSANPGRLRRCRRCDYSVQPDSDPRSQGLADG